MTTIYTIGYEGTDIDRFVATLQAVGIEMVVDVRAVALSRKKGFSKTALQSRLTGAGLEYLHLIELGDPKPGREAARAGLFDKFRRIYGQHLASERPQLALEKLAAIVEQKNVCLLCFERNPKECHRSIVAESIKKRGWKIFDLFGDSPNRYNEEFSKSRYSRQSAAAA